MQLFNKSTRIFAIKGRRIAPQEAFEVDEVQGEKLLRLYPDEITILSIKTEISKEEKPITITTKTKNKNKVK